MIWMDMQLKDGAFVFRSFGEGIFHVYGLRTLEGAVRVRSVRVSQGADLLPFRSGRYQKVTQDGFLELRCQPRVRFPYGVRVEVHPGDRDLRLQILVG